MTYLTIEQAAQKAHVAVDEVMQLVKLGFVQRVEKGDLVFLSSSEAYKLRFISYLQSKHQLELPEIENILKTQQPPYADWQKKAATVH